MSKIKCKPEDVYLPGYGNLGVILQHFNCISVLIADATPETLAKWDTLRNKALPYPHIVINHTPPALPIGWGVEHLKHGVYAVKTRKGELIFGLDEDLWGLLEDLVSRDMAGEHQKQTSVVIPQGWQFESLNESYCRIKTSRGDIAIGRKEDAHTLVLELAKSRSNL